MSAAQHPSTRQDLRVNRVGSRIAFNEQLRLFAPANDVRGPAASARPWAFLALALALLPWVVAGLMIWELT